MTDRNKLEEMLQRLINEDAEGAKELFHELVVEEAREIYQKMLETEEDDTDDDLDETFDFDTFESNDDEFEFGGDETDDMIDDIEMDDDMDDDDMDDDDMDDDDMDDDMDDDDMDEIKSQIQDLQDSLDELTAKYDDMDDDDMDDDDMDDDDMDDDDMDDDDMDDDDMDDEPKTRTSETEQMREYVEKVAAGHGAEKKATGDNGANTKSIVATKNDMGGTTKNLRGGKESTTGGTHGGLLNTKPVKHDVENVNVPGGKAGKTAAKNKAPGHGAEKKGAGETADVNSVSAVTKVQSRTK